MREIKFRAWDGKELKQVDQITISKNTWSCESGYGVSIPYMPHIILMQYTGLKDKDGKEIYEGDITKGLLEVKFGNGCFYTTFEGNTQSDTILTQKRCPYIEVIGNIYENPELLTN